MGKPVTRAWKESQTVPSGVGLVPSQQVKNSIKTATGQRKTQIRNVRHTWLWPARQSGGVTISTSCFGPHESNPFHHDLSGVSKQSPAYILNKYGTSWGSKMYGIPSESVTVELVRTVTGSVKTCREQILELSHHRCKDQGQDWLLELHTVLAHIFPDKDSWRGRSSGMTAATGIHAKKVFVADEITTHDMLKAHICYVDVPRAMEEFYQMTLQGSRRQLLTAGDIHQQKQRCKCKFLYLL